MTANFLTMIGCSATSSNFWNRRAAAGDAEDTLSPEEEIKDPFILEFLGLKDEYSETELEEALIRQLETFLEAELARSRRLLQNRRPSRSKRQKRGKTSLEA